MKEVYNIPLDTKFEILKSTYLYTTPNGTEFVQDKVPEIKPVKGEFFVKRKGLELKPGDWVLFGVASTPSVDLVNDAILDIKNTFGDSLEEFVNSGRIFYEHGYKHAGNPSKHPDIDVPIGVPIAAEIADNKLYVWILLDKNHELAQKVYKHLQSSDDRFFSKIGLSIGAIPIGKSQTKLINGIYVNVPPKMRLYEVSITGQPINTETFVKVLKSLVYNSVDETTEENMAKNLKDLLTDEQKDNEMQGLEEENLMTEETMPKEEAETQMEGKETEQLDLGVQEGALGQEDVLSEQKTATEDEGTQEEDVSLLQEEVEEHKEEDQEAFNYILDKLDFLEEKLSELLSMLSEEKGTKEEDEGVVSSSLAELKSFVENKIEKLENKINYVVDVVEASLENFSELKSVLEVVKSYHEKIDSIEKSLSTFKHVYDEVNEKLNATTKSANSLLNSPKVGLNTEIHPQTGAFEQNLQEKLKSILLNKTKLKSLEDRLQDYFDSKGTPSQMAEKKSELYRFAKEEFGLEPEEFDIIYKQYKNNRKISQ